MKPKKETFAYDRIKYNCARKGGGKGYMMMGGAHSLIVTLFLLIVTHAKPKPDKLKMMSVNLSGLL
ncbi:transmembrane protein, putative [Medicago truncatula]|uniref:Transmembrane protein, putative n=1 Tax=Medicago truncatula TaxID=3880 RepID=A0A072UN49_MEDTR|nr:transmembrane protein, putative [Medicago truncatula]